MKKNILLLGDYIVDEFLKDLCEINSDYKVSHIYILNTTPEQDTLIKENKIEVVRGWHDYTVLIDKSFDSDILNDSKFKQEAFNTIKSFFRFTDNQDFFYHETVYYELVNYWIQFFRKNKISLVIGGNPSFLESITILVAEKVFGIRVVTRKLLSRQPEDNSYRVYFFDRKNEISVPLNSDKNFLIKTVLFPNYSKLKFKGFPKLIKELFRSFINFNFSYFFLILSNTLNFFKVKRGLKKMVVKPELNSNFIYYPLHFDPEIVTMPEEDVRANQGINIKKLAVNLPKGWYLYVKVHPNQFNFKLNFWVWEFYGQIQRYYISLKHFKYLNQIPNVVLIDDSISQRDLIQKSKSVASISGTVFLEASFYKKPLLIFGRNTLYRQFSNSFSIESKRQIKKAIKEIQKHSSIESDAESILQNHTYSSKIASKADVINQLMKYLAQS